MKIIGAGFMRTGTMTMQKALNTLGYRCYHMKEVPAEKGHLDTWYQFLAEGISINWKHLFQNFDATMDLPACIYYKELMEIFPEAKVVLNVRDPDGWFNSFQSLLAARSGFRGKTKALPELDKMFRFTDCLFKNMFGDRINREHCIEIFHKHNEAVKRYVPQNQLLVYNVTEGWSPLCNFLNHPIPKEIDFPHLNKGGETIKSFLQKSFIETEPPNKLFKEKNRINRSTLNGYSSTLFPSPLPAKIAMK